MAGYYGAGFRYQDKDETFRNDEQGEADEETVTSHDEQDHGEVQHEISEAHQRSQYVHAKVSTQTCLLPVCDDLTF